MIKTPVGTIYHDIEIICALLFMIDNPCRDDACMWGTSLPMPDAAVLMWVNLMPYLSFSLFFSRTQFHVPGAKGKLPTLPQVK
jgi:hypothetical protein